MVWSESGCLQQYLQHSQSTHSIPELVTLSAVYPTGKVCLSIVNADQGWKPAISVKQVQGVVSALRSSFAVSPIRQPFMQILTGIQDMLNNPNNSDPAQEEGYNVYRKNKAEYERCVSCT